VPRSRKIVFFFPSFASSDATAPARNLGCSTPLMTAGYQNRSHRLHIRRTIKNASSKKLAMLSALASLWLPARDSRDGGNRKAIKAMEP